jgi:small subunit ribosomal protein S27Ae
MKKIEFFKIEGDRINRIRKHCPKCGPAVFLAEHSNRFSCGKCGYTEFKGGNKPPKITKNEEKPIEQSVETKSEGPIKEVPIEKEIKEEVPPMKENEAEEKPSIPPQEESTQEEKPKKEEIPGSKENEEKSFSE